MRTIVFLLIILIMWSCNSENSIRFTVDKGDGIFLTQPVSFDLTRAEEAQIDIKNMVLSQEVGKEDVEIPFQINPKENKIWFIPVTEKNSDGPLNYSLRNGVSSYKSDSGLSEKKTRWEFAVEFSE